MSNILGVDLIPFPDDCTLPQISITSAIAARIYRVLVGYACADPCLATAFAYMTSDVAQGGLGRRQFCLKDGYYGVLAFYACGDDWFCVTSLEDLSPGTNTQLNTVNLQLALLRDQIKLELSL